MPLQHADETMLRSMHRGGTRDSLRRLLDRVRGELGDPVVRSTFIVGYPGETEKMFEELCGFVDEIRFDRIAVFRYSPEEGSAAAKLPGRVPDLVAEYRRDSLLALQEEIAGDRASRFVGRIERVLVCHHDADDGWTARTTGQAPDIDGQTWLGDSGLELERGRTIDVEITGADAYDLYGSPVFRAPGIDADRKRN